MKCTIEGTLKHVLFYSKYLNNFDLQSVTVAVLIELGVATKRNGFDYLKKAVMLLYEEPVSQVTKDIYPAVGACYSPAVGKLQVEQAIRSAINEAWKNRDEDVWAYYFPQGKKPSNAEFISGIVRFLELLRGCRKEAAYEK